MNLAVIGAGAFGRNHIRVYRELSRSGAVRLAAIIEPDPGRAAALREEFFATGGAASPLPAPRIVATLESCLEAHRNGELPLHAASVCVPTSAHAAVASALLEAGIDVLVEKPIAATLAEAGRLATLAQQHGRILQVGHLERFNPAVTAIEPHLNGPMFFEAHRLSIFSPRSLDVDVVLDLMIHDLDIVLSFARSPVRHLHAVGLPILSGKVDIANVRVEFESGCVANFTASRVSTEKVRKLRFFQPHQYVSLDYARQDLLVIHVDPGKQTGTAKLPPPSPPDMRDSPLPPGLSLQKPQVHAGEPLRLEIEAFLESVRTRQQPRVTADDGRHALALALEINEAIAAHAKHAGLDRFAQSY